MDGTRTRITNQNSDTLPQLSNNKKFIVFLRNLTLPSIYNDDLDAREPKAIIYYDIESGSEKILARSCYSRDEKADKFSSTTIEDPNYVLCDFDNPRISADDKIIYFSSYSGVVGTGNTNYINIGTWEIHHFGFGGLVELRKDGTLELEVTYNLYAGKDNPRGRVWKTWLYNKKGKPIRLLDDYGTNPDMPPIIVPDKKGIIISLTAPEIVKRYRRNEVAADELLQNAKVNITGTVLDFDKEDNGDYTVTLKGNKEDSNVFISMKNNQNIKLMKGQVVTINGKVSGFLKDVIVIDGVIVK